MAFPRMLLFTSGTDVLSTCQWWVQVAAAKGKRGEDFPTSSVPALAGEPCAHDDADVQDLFSASALLVTYLCQNLSERVWSP